MSINKSDEITSQSLYEINEIEYEQSQSLMKPLIHRDDQVC